MRNIKTSLRFVRNSALLFVAASGVTYLAGCQSEHGLNSGNNEPTPEPSLSTASYSVYGPNQGRVTNYGLGTTRVGEYVEAAQSFDMPESVAIPADAKDIANKLVEVIEHEYWTETKETDYYNYGSPEAGSYVIKSGDTLSGGIDAKNGHVDLYVEGTWNTGDNVKGDLTVYVLGTGVVNFQCDTFETDVTLYNYGSIKGGSVCFAGKLYSAVDITEVKIFGVNAGAKLFSKQSIVADDVRLNGDAVACAFIANKIDIHSVGTIKTSYFEATDLTLNSGNVVLDNNGLVKATNLYVSNNETLFTVNGTHAVVAAKKFTTNNVTWPKNTFAANIAMDLDKCYIKDTETPYSDFEWQVSAENQVKWVPAAGCHGEYGQKPEDNNGGKDDDNTGDEENNDPEPPAVVPDTPDQPIVTPEIVKIVDIEGLDDEINHGNHDHGIISATCITFGADGTAYASYHLRGNGDGNKNPNYVGTAQKGCIEVIKDNGAAGMELGSYMIAPDWDFNHLIVDGNNIITVGNAKEKDAFIASLPTNFEAITGISGDMKVRELTTNEPLMGPSKDDPDKEIKIGFKNAGDGNCVVRQGNYYYVATYGGYGPLNLDFSRVNDANGNKIFTKTNGSAKHIALNGNGKMSVIAHDTYDKTSSTASVYTFDASDYSFSTVLNKYDAIGTIKPVDGKNVIAMDGDEIYACLSQGGLVRLSDGKTFKRGKNNNVPVNGMAFDEKYIYVANGSFVSVLDKATMNEICYYHAASQKSANYIALRNGKIYVAFGEDGIQVFQLVEKEISQN